MRKQNVPLKRLATEDALEHLADEMKFPNLESLYVAIGEGQVSPQSIVARLARSVQGSPEEDVSEVPLARPLHPGARGRHPRVRHARAGRLGPPHRLP